MELLQARPAADGRIYGAMAELWPLLSPPADYREEVLTFRSRFARHGVADGARLLHLGCGGGSADFELKRFYRVTGVDISEAMLAQARRLNPDVDYRAGDIRTFRMEERFDAVLVHDAISYMTTPADLRAAYRTAAAHLAAGGVMVALPEELRSRLSPDEPQATTRHADGRTVTMIELSHDADPADNCYEQVYVFLVRDGGELRVEVERHLNGVYELAEFTDAIRDAGFEPTVEPWELSTWAEGEEPMPLITAIRVGE